MEEPITVDGVVIKTGSILVNGIGMLVKHDDVALFEIDCHSKYPDTMMGGCMDASQNLSIPVVYLDASKDTLKANEGVEVSTEIIFEGFNGWDVYAVSSGRYSVQVTLVNYHK